MSLKLDIMVKLPVNSTHRIALVCPVKLYTYKLAHSLVRITIRREGKVKELLRFKALKPHNAIIISRSYNFIITRNVL